MRGIRAIRASNHEICGNHSRNQMIACFLPVDTFFRKLLDQYFAIPQSPRFSPPNMHPPAKNSLRGLFYEVQRHQRQRDQQHITDPGIEPSQIQPIENV